MSEKPDIPPIEMQRFLAAGLFEDRWEKARRCGNGKRRRAMMARLRRSAVNVLILRPFYASAQKMPDTTPIDGWVVLS